MSNLPLSIQCPHCSRVFVRGAAAKSSDSWPVTQQLTCPACERTFTRFLPYAVNNFGTVPVIPQPRQWSTGPHPLQAPLPAGGPALRPVTQPSVRVIDTENHEAQTD